MKGGDEHAPDIIAGQGEGEPADPTRDERRQGRADAAEGRSACRRPKIATLTAWIEQGAVWPDGADLVKLEDKRDHWSFKPVTNPAPPETKDKAWPRNDIDRFILARLEKEGLRPSPEADRVTWLRRVSFDLIGLPPSPEQVEAFCQRRTRSDAYERVGGRSAEVAALRRALGAALARCRALRGHARLRGEHRAPQCLAVSRLCDPRLQRRHAVRPLHPRADRGRCAGRGRGHGVPRHGVGAAARADRQGRAVEAARAAGCARRDRR